MNMKMKIAKILLIICFCFALPAYAGEYTPLVQIPGLGATVTISSYLIGIYNFFLSIVGIVAVLMLILGGMRYISAAGNSSAISDAKSMIGSALWGLLLALLSWIFVSTINPDILYVRQPGLTSSETINAHSITFIPSASTDCIAPGSSNGTDGTAIENCTCADLSEAIFEEGSTCNEKCISEKKCGNKFLVVKLTTDLKDGVDVATKIWQFFLTNNGEYDEFNINAINYLGTAVTDNEKYSCGILATEENNGNDANYVYWVREGVSVIGPDSHSISNALGDDNIVSCSGCETGGGPADCNLNQLGQCGLPETGTVLRARFDDKVEDGCDETNCTLADWKSGAPSYRPKVTIKCVAGFWKVLN
jgi:hypothetical protein